MLMAYNGDGKATLKILYEYITVGFLGDLVNMLNQNGIKLNVE